MADGVGMDAREGEDEAREAETCLEGRRQRGGVAGDATAVHRLPHAAWPVTRRAGDAGHVGAAGRRAGDLPHSPTRRLHIENHLVCVLRSLSL